MATENQIRLERQQVFNTIRPVIEKVNRGERLSAAEQRSLADAHTKIVAGGIELSEARDIRAAGEDASRGLYAAEDRQDDSAESRAFSNYLRTGAVAPEMRAAGESTGSAGGYMVPPGWWRRLQIALKAYGGTAADFQLVETDTGQPMLWATNDPTGVIGQLIAENTQITDVDYVFGQGQLSAYMFSSGVHKVSYQLANDSAFDIDQFVQARVAEALGRAEAQYAISGTGSSQPLGIITALNAATGLTSGGVFSLTAGNKVNVIGPNGGTSTTGTNQVTELTAGTLSPTTFVSVLKSVDPSYRALGAKWYMSDATLQATRLIANGFGEPYYPEIQDDKNPTLYGYPVVVDQNIPALTASTASGIIFGHLQSAMVLRRVRGGSMSRVEGAGLLKLDQRYADFLQVGYIGYERIDIRSNDLRAAVVVKAGAN